MHARTFLPYSQGVFSVRLHVVLQSIKDPHVGNLRVVAPFPLPCCLLIQMLIYTLLLELIDAEDETKCNGTLLDPCLALENSRKSGWDIKSVFLFWCDSCPCPLHPSPCSRVLVNQNFLFLVIPLLPLTLTCSDSRHAPKSPTLRVLSQFVNSITPLL